GPLGTDARTLLKRLDEERDVSIRRALILSLGAFDEKHWPPDKRTGVVEKLRAFYLHDADAGLHGAAEWLLRHWKQDQWLKQTDQEWAKDKEQNKKRLEHIKQELMKEKEKAQPQWYVTGQGQTMVVIPGPVTFRMGSPPTEAGRTPAEQLHQKRVGR